MERWSKSRAGVEVGAVNAGNHFDTRPDEIVHKLELLLAR